MKLNQNFLGGEGVQNKKTSVGGVWIFSETTQCLADLQLHRLKTYDFRMSKVKYDFEKIIQWQPCYMKMVPIKCKVKISNWLILYI